MFERLLAMAGVIRHIFSAHSCNTPPTEGIPTPIMPDVTHSASIKPPLPIETPSLGLNASAIPSLFADATLPPPLDDMHMQVHTILTVAIFCFVCLLLLSACVYASCLHCSIGSSPKELHAADGWDLEREDATYRCTSTENYSVGNVV